MHHRIVIIGIGNAAKPHIAAVAELENAQLVGGSCRSREKGEAFEREQGARWYDDTAKMLDEAKPTVAIVCTPSGTHIEVVQACARRGVHVLCEKPLEITAERIDRMIAVAGEAGVALGGVFQQRYNEALRAVHDAAAAGRLGPLAVASVSVPWWRADEYYGPDRWQGTAALDGGGALINQSIHGVDALQWIAAAADPDLPPEANPVEEVFCWTARRGHDADLIEVEDACIAVLRFRGGGLGQVLATTAMYPGSLRRLIVGGRGGTAEVVENDLAQYDFRDERPGDDDVRQRLVGGNEDTGGAADPMAFSHVNHRTMLADFLAALDRGDPPPLPATEARKAVAIIEACYRSAKSGHREVVT